jgi:LPXTG-motif cell wall-anchored protein
VTAIDSATVAVNEVLGVVTGLPQPAPQPTPQPAPIGPQPAPQPVPDQAVAPVVSQQAPVAQQQLPRTGSNSLALVALAALLVGAGALTLRRPARERG